MAAQQRREERVEEERRRHFRLELDYCAVAHCQRQRGAGAVPRAHQHAVAVESELRCALDEFEPGAGGRSDCAAPAAEHVGLAEENLLSLATGVGSVREQFGVEVRGSGGAFGLEGDPESVEKRVGFQLFCIRSDYKGLWL